MKKHLVTQDLISSVDWALKAPNTQVKEAEEGLTWRKKALIDLENKLNRVKGDFPIAAQRGVDFENKVYSFISKGKLNVGSGNFQKVLQRLKNHTFQEKIKITEKISNYECFLYGKIDAYKPGDMIDIKTTQEYKKEKYLNSIQHKLYCYGKKETRFTYIVVEWLDYPVIKNVHRVEINIDDLDLLRLEVHCKILETFETLKDLDLWEAYREKYCLY
jgi:hypothetical protein